VAQGEGGTTGKKGTGNVAKIKKGKVKSDPEDAQMLKSPEASQQRSP